MYKESTSNHSSSNPATKSGTSGAVATLGTSSSLCDDEPVLDSVLELLRINTVSAADDDEDGEGLDEMVSPSLTTSSPDLLTSSSACSSLHSSQSTSPLPPLSPTSPSMLLASSTHSESFSGCSSPNTMTVSAEDHHLHQHFPSSGSPSSTTATTIAASGSSHSPAISIPPVSASGSSAAGTTTKRRYRLAKKRAMPPRSNSTPLPPDSESGSVVASSCPNSASSGGGGGGSGSGSGSGSFSSRMSRFAYSESLQKRIISSFLRQNSAEDITATGKKKSGSGGGGKLVDSDAVSVPPLDEIKASHSSGGILRNTKAVSLSNIKSSSVPSIVKRADSKEGKDSPSKGTPVAEQSFSRRNTGESAIAEKPNFLLMNRAKPKLSTLSNEPNMRSTVGGCGYSSSSLNISSNISTITSSPPTSIPSIVVNECASNGPSPAPGDQPGDETENGKFPDDFKKTIQGEIKIQAENGETRVLRSAPDWTESAINGDHLWVSSNTSGSDLCYVGERECLKTGPRLCCPVCKVIAHTGCISILIDKMKIHCKPTFKDGVRQYREQQIVKHHWVHRRHEKGRCKSCGKSFQSKLTFGGNKQEVVAVSCSWCKASYHNKAQCINEGTLTEACDFGNYAQIIVPPTWIVKLPRKGSFKSSIRRTPRNKRLSSKRRSKNKAADASSSSSCSLVVNSSASAAAVMAAASSSPNVLLVTGGGAGGQSSSERAKLSLNNGTLFSSSNNMGSSSGGGSSITIASSSLTSTSSPGSSPSPSSVILGLHQEGSGNGAGAGAGAASATLSVTPSPFLMGAHNGGNSSSGGGSSTTSPGGPSPSPPPLPPAPELPAHSFTPPPPPPPSGSAHSHYYSKHNSGQISEMSGGPAHLYGAMVPSPMGVGGGGGGGVGGGGSRRQYRRHSHAAVSASSLTSSGLLSAEGKDGGGGGLPYGHSVSTSHYLQTVHRSFTIKPIPSPNLKPLLVFINPKSGGNQGAKLMQKFQWHLNPRQVFDLSQGGPRLGLDLYKKVHNLRVLACGGDGTAGWVLSTIDEIGIVPPPPIAVLPLGTGNDLARSINWGASYTDEPVSKILCNIQDGEVVQLDRWNLKVQRNPHVSAAHSSGEEAKGAKPDLPLNVVNNYFSIGVDAHIALSFHEAREAHPERFNSRFKNRIFYGQAGSKDLMQRKWKDLSNYVKLVCDGVDYTSRLKELKVHSVLFLNIPSYSGGTRPWAPSSSYDPQSTNDGQIEVIGLTTYQLPLLQAGGHGTPIAQCQSARITTTRTIPMQVDGEPCKLLPSIIVLELRNKANLIAKTKSIALHRQMPTLEKITLKVRKLNLVDYETYHYDKERLRDLSTLLGSITIEQNLELIHVRTRVNDLMKEKGFSVVGAPEVCSVASSLAVAALGGGTGSNTSSPSKTAASLASVNLTTLPSTSFNSPVCVSSSSASSVSSKFVSNDWCFVDSCTAERFFRIDRAQEHLHYVVDICNEDLYILDPQFDESKDEAIDILTTEEVLTAAEVLCPDDVTDQGSVDQLSTDTTDQPSSGDQADAKPQLQSIDENSNLPGLLSLNNGNKLTSTSASSSAACDANKLSLPGLSATTSSTTANTNSNNSNNTSGNCLRPGSSTSDLDSVSSLAVSPADLTIGRHSFLSTSNHNGSIGSPSPLSPQPPSSPYTTCSIDSPPRSPRRGQKALSPQSYRLQDQLMSAAQTGDVGLLKNLHHQGVNLMGVDENRMTALHHAAMNGHESAVAFLLNAFTPDVVDLADRLRGQTALHHAVMAGHRNISTMLVIRGATLSAKDHQGRSALDLAHFLGRHDLALALSHLFTANNRETTV